MKLTARSALRASAVLALGLLFGSGLAGAQNIQTFAGGAVGDGPSALSASLSFPGELAIDSAGNLYVADWSNHRVRKVTPTGVTSTVAGTGFSGSTGDGGSALQARLNKPYGLTFDQGGNLYIAEQAGNRIRKVAPNGTISTVAGDGTSTILDEPQYLAVAPDGTLYVSLSNSHQVLKVVNGVVSPFAGNGTAGFSGDSAAATSAQLNVPSGLLVEPGGSVLIADLLNNKVRRVDTSGNISTFKGLNGPYDLAYNAAGELHVASYCIVWKLSPAGVSTRLIGDDTCPIGFGGDGGSQDLAAFNNIMAIAIAADGRILINDRFNQRVRVASGGLVNTFMGPGANGNGSPALGARLSEPSGMAYDSAGNLYVAERYINMIRKITPAGVISTFAGTGAPGFSGDGGLAVSATFNEPRGLAVDLAGNLLIADYRNSRIRSISPGGVISTIAGGGTLGDGSLAISASVSSPNQILVDAIGDIYVSQGGRVRKIHDGIISTFAGGGTVFGDNLPATSVKLGRPAQMAFDGAGNFFFADSTYHNVRRVDTSGTIMTVAGTHGVSGESGDGGLATQALMASPHGLFVFANGDFIVSAGARLRKVTGGIIDTIAGTGVAGFDGDGPALSALMEPVSAIGRNPAGAIVFVEPLNNRARMLGGASGQQPSLSIADASITEGNSGSKSLQFTVTLSAAPTSAVSLSFSTIDGSASAGSDYAALALNSQTIAAGQTSKVVTVTITGDNAVEPDETLELKVSNVVGASVADGIATGTIVNDDAHSGPVLSMADVSIAEGNSLTKTATFTVSLSAAQPGPVLFDVATANGTATSGSDYVAKSTLGLRIPIGATSRTFLVTINGDIAAEADETFTVNLSNASGAGIADAQAVGTISNDDAAQLPALTVADVSTMEGNESSHNAGFLVSLSAPSAVPITFDVATADMTASAGSDYTALSLPIVVPANTTSYLVNVSIVGDHMVEAGETFSFTVSNLVGASPGDIQAVGTITNDDEPTPVTLSIADAFLTEGNAGTTTATFTVSLSSAAASPVIFDVATSDISARAGTDYVASAQGGLTISPGQTTKTVSVTVIGDTNVEADETFVVNVSNVTGATVDRATATGFISNDDGGGTPSLSVSDGRVSEGDASNLNMGFVVSLSEATDHTVFFDLVTSDGSAVSSSDYDGRQGRFFVVAGQTSASYGVLINGDTQVESHETFTLTLSNVDGAVLVDGTATGTILNDDGIGTQPMLTIGDVSVLEGNAGSKTISLAVSLSVPAPADVSFMLSTDPGSALAGSDFIGMEIGGTILAGSSSKNFAVTINGDTDVELDEFFVANVSQVIGALQGDVQAFVNIINDDGISTPSLSINDISITEGNLGTKLATFTVNLSAAPSLPVGFDLASTDGNATAGVDYVALALAGQTIAAGQTSKSFSVTINGDSTVEPNETFLVNVSNVSNATVSDGQAIGTISNDDNAGGPALSVGDVSVAEGNSATKTLTFTVTASATSPSPMLFDIATANGTATAGSDYVAKSTLGLRIPIGSTSKTFAVTINGDTVGEPDETFLVNLSNTSGATIADGQATGTITNDDTAATPTLSIADLSISEGNTGTKVATFTVSLSPAAAGTVTYSIATANGTATAGSDYVASSLSGQTIAAGVTSKTFAVTINGDTTTEPNETFSVALSSVVGATLGDGNATGTITNDEASGGTPTLSIGDVTIAEGNSLSKQATFTVTLSAAASGPVTYNIATANGTAVSGTDYVAKSLTAQSIPAGSLSKIFTVGVRGDTVVEPNETFVVNVSSVAGATLADGQATGTISNDDASVLRIARFDARGLVDDIDDGNYEPQVSPGEYASLMLDTANRLCGRTGSATVVAVDAVENARVLDELAQTVNGTCGAGSRYQAVMGLDHAIGFLVEATASTDARGAQILDTPMSDDASGLISLRLTASGHDSPLWVLVPRALPATGTVRDARLRAIAQQVRMQRAGDGDGDARLVLIGNITVPGLLDLTRKSRPPTTALPAERLLVSPVLLREFSGTRVEFLPVPANDTPAQVLQLQR